MKLYIRTVFALVFILNLYKFIQNLYKNYAILPVYTGLLVLRNFLRKLYLPQFYIMFV